MNPSLSNPSYSGPTIHSIYAAALNNSDTKYTSEVQPRILTTFRMCKFLISSFTVNLTVAIFKVLKSFPKSPCGSLVNFPIFLSP